MNARAQFCTFGEEADSLMVLTSRSPTSGCFHPTGPAQDSETLASGRNCSKAAVSVNQGN